MKHFLSKIIILKTIVLLAFPMWAQDIIVTSDAQKIDAKILEVSKNEIKYKELDNMDGPTFVLATSDKCKQCKISQQQKKRPSGAFL